MFKMLLATSAVASDWLQGGNLPFEPPVWGLAVVRQPNGRHCCVNNWEGGDNDAGRARISRALRAFAKRPYRLGCALVENSGAGFASSS